MGAGRLAREAPRGQRLSEGAAELEYDGMYEPSADEAWMGGFDAQK